MTISSLHTTGISVLAATLLISGCLHDGSAPPADRTDTGVQTDSETSNKADDISENADTGPVDTDRPDDAANDDTVEPDPWDCAPDLQLVEDRYADHEPLEDDRLAAELADTVDGHDDQGYDAARELLWDIETRDHGELECVYTDDTVEADGTNLPDDETTTFNTEHTWPRSRGADDPPAESDVHHLFAVEIDANNRRANHEFGHVDCDDTTCEWHRDESFLGPSAEDDRDPVFEVQPERRGDVARAILYFSIRYDQPVSPGEESVLRQWNCQDPPDDYERMRNDEIEAFQGNRNPFVDRPDFVDRIDEF